MKSESLESLCSEVICPDSELVQKHLKTLEQMVRPVVESIKLGPFDIPRVFFRRITDAKIILTPTPGWPLETNIQTLQVHPRKLQINPTVN